MQTCVVGGLVTSPDDEDERLHIVKRGRVRLYRLTPDGKQLTLEILDKGRIVGRMSWLGQRAQRRLRRGGGGNADLQLHARGAATAHRSLSGGAYRWYMRRTLSALKAAAERRAVRTRRHPRAAVG